jgi:hypothetical protein
MKTAIVIIAAAGLTLGSMAALKRFAPGLHKSFV